MPGVMELIFCVSSPYLRFVYISAWQGDAADLYTHYRDVYGHELDVVIFSCDNGMSAKHMVQSRLGLYHMEGDLYNRDCLPHFSTICNDLGLPHFSTIRHWA